MYDTLVINLFGGPGAGKSTTAAYVFSQIKWMGYEAELVTEFVKDLIWEHAVKSVQDQIFIFSNQLFRIRRLLGEVEFIIVDSPVMLSLVYSDDPVLHQLARSEHLKMNTYNVALKRAIKYSTIGRMQSEQEAIGVDEEVSSMLVSQGIDHDVFEGTQGGGDQIVNKIVYGINGKYPGQVQATPVDF